MTLPQLFKWDEASREKAVRWHQFLEKNEFNFSLIKAIDLIGPTVQMTDIEDRKFSIDFIGDHLNYNKKKGSIKTELISKALGKGDWGLKVLDLTAGLAVDSFFLAQLGYEVKACERNPLIFLALDEALKQARLQPAFDLKIEFFFGEALQILQQDQDVDVIYFDPMFPEKKKSALPKQEMVFFKNMVGSDDDAATVIEHVLKSKTARRLIVKRPLKAEVLAGSPHHQLEGKLIRFDIYNLQTKPS